MDLNIHRFNNERLERLISCPTVKHRKTSTRNLASANQPYILSKRRQENDEMVMSFVALACMGGPMQNLQTYLTCGDLPGDPLVDSAWAYLWSSQNDRAFITTMGVDVNTFHVILQPFSLLHHVKLKDHNRLGQHHFDASSPGAEARRRHAATQGQPKHSTTTGLKRLCAAYNPARRAHQTPSGASDEQLFYQGQLGASGSMTRSIQVTHNGTRHVRPADAFKSVRWTGAGLKLNQSVIQTLLNHHLDASFWESVQMTGAVFRNLTRGVWDGETITRANVNPCGAPQPGRRTLDSAGCLGLVLHWLSSTMLAYNLQQLFAVTPAVCSRYLKCGLQHLPSVLKDLRAAWIVWPSSERETQAYSDSIEAKYPLLTCCFGFLDGLDLPILVSDDDE
ncbi:hypothetical protein PCANC_10268 [Puccinia coronata f. sp. avenae]|uniref:Uncharacterized protein n=1 Tax=Puccinia coronata f. sp. avenae TaxID=200324 RepID=A0A2N5VQF1_9BASI|nr:hypothetical protein PCANC_10268 [Puccinia coronata f. sp. avenae]